ncbi:putative alpha/Beta hydrolase [Rosa chinensis]|uniref:Putative alpha/Beta hydrolase n=1 Tax=Rosa chinensis TaxID=74649 RepID=A0A2P6PF67_ROSCH|nr:putative alpha/Beta hydrolase [Rosa chinensis]
MPSSLAFKVLRLLCLLQSTEVGISSILDAALASPETSGVYFFGGKGQTFSSSMLSYDAKLAKALWNTSSDRFLESQLAFKETSTSVSNCVDSYVKIFPKVAHGWAVRYDVYDAASSAEEAHNDMLQWFAKHVK